MSDYQEENPYASPEGAAEAASLEAESYVWRDGDEAVMRASKAKSPNACWVTNRDRRCWRCAISSSLRTDIAMLLVMALPVAGVPLYLLVMWLLIRRGQFPKGLQVWIAWPWAVLRWLAIAPACLAICACLVLSNAALLSLNPALGLLAILCAGVTVLLLAFVERSSGLTVRRDEGGVFRVRGVHPDYLARLPSYDESDTAAAMASEPGESPFADSAR